MQSSLQTRNRKRGKGKRRKYEPYATAASYLRLAAETYSPFCRSPFKRQRASGRANESNQLFAKAPSFLALARGETCAGNLYSGGRADSRSLILRDGDAEFFLVCVCGCKARLSFTFPRSYFTFSACLRRPKTHPIPAAARSQPCFTWQDKGALTYDVLTKRGN